MEKLEVYFVLAITLIIFSIFIQNYGDLPTGLTTIDDEPPNMGFGIEAATAPFVNLQFPINHTNVTTGYVNFTYNVSDVDGADSVDNCTLWLNIDGGGYEANETTFLGTWRNQTNGVGVAEECGAALPLGITTNGSDFWIMDNTDNFVYHLNVTYDNRSDGFDVGEKCNIDNPYGITTNGSDFWFTEQDHDFIYHINVTFDNDTRAGLQGFNVSTKVGSRSPAGITTNGSDFWFVDTGDDFIYHVNFSGDNKSDGISTAAYGSDSPGGIVTNGSDFWTTDGADDFVYHLNSTGDNQSDGFKIRSECGSELSRGITTPSYNMSNVNPGGIPKDFWIVDSTDNFVYHVKKEVQQIINQSFNKTFGTDRKILWKVGCYDNSTLQSNSSVFNLTVDITAPFVNLRSPANDTTLDISYVSFFYNVTDAIFPVDSCILWLYKSDSWELNSTDSSITETINQSINITIPEDRAFKWKIECNDTVNNRGNSTIRRLTIDLPVGSVGGPSHTRSKSNVEKIISTEGLTSIVEFNNPTIPVISIELKLIEEAQFKLKLKRVFESFVNPKLENAYSYFEIEANLDEDNFEYINLNFKVEKDYYNIEFYKLDNGNSKLGINKIHEDEKYKYYQVPINSLGYFAITAEPPETLLSGSITKTLDKIKTKGLASVSGIILFIILIIFVFNYVIMHKKKTDKVRLK